MTGLPVKVLHLYSGNRFGGAETYLLTLARQRKLCPEMEHAFALCFKGLLSESLDSLGVPCDILGPARLSRPWTVWKVRRRLRRLLKATAPDVVFCHSYWPQVVLGPAVLKAGVPLAYRSTDVPRGGDWLEKAASRVRPRLIVANSANTADSIRQHVYPDIPVKVVYNPVDDRTPDDPPEVRKRIRQLLGVEPEQVVFIVASRLVRLKGLHVLVQALSRLSGRADWQCWIAGGAQDEQEQAYAAELRDLALKQGVGDRIQLLGQRQDVPDLLCAADVYCQPNIEPDAFGIVFIEALYAGLPIVTSELGGPVEILDDTCGLLLPPGDDAKLASVLGELLDNPELRRHLADAGPVRAKALSDPSRQMRLLYETLSSIVGG